MCRNSESESLTQDNITVKNQKKRIPSSHKRKKAYQKARKERKYLAYVNIADKKNKHFKSDRLDVLMRMACTNVLYF